MLIKEIKRLDLLIKAKESLDRLMTEYMNIEKPVDPG